MKSPRRNAEKVHPSKYEIDTAERRDFRNRMKAELKALAKESFLEELERLRLNNTNIISHNETDTKQITQELYQLQSVVEELRRETHHQNQMNSNNMKVEWSNTIVRDQGGFALPSINHGYPEEPATSRGDDNQVFVLSCAPIQGFNRAMNVEGGSLDAPLSLLDQANRFAEMQSLFHLPAHLSEEDVRFMQPTRTPAEIEATRQQKLTKEKKLQSSIDTHVDRLDRSRNPPRRYPLQTKPSNHFSSPRAKIHRAVDSNSRSMEKSIDLNDTNKMKFPLEKSNNQYGSPQGTARGQPEPPTFPGFTTPAAPTTADGSATNLSLTAAIENALAASTTLNATDATVAAGGNVSASNSPSGKKQVIQAPATPAVVYTTDEFKDKTDKLAEEIKKLVKEAVQQEMDNEGKTYHYTKRFQKHLKTTKEDSLVNRIEKTVEEKIKQLENEVTELRKVKLNKGKKYRTLDDLDDEDGVNRDGQWYLRNELADDMGNSQLDMRSLTKDINASVQMIIQRHLSPLRKGGYYQDDEEEDDGREMSAPQSTVHGHIRSNNQDRNREKDSIGFDSGPGETFVSPPKGTASGNKAQGNNNSNGATPSAVTSPSSASAIEEEVVPVKRSKADRLLGISTDAKTGLPFNSDIQPSQKAGLFGSIGSLFSSKPNSGGGGAMGSMTSDRYSTMNPRAAHPKHGLDTIVDEGNEDEHTGNFPANKSISGESRSDRHNRGPKGAKSRRDSSNSLTENTSAKSDTSASGTTTAVINPQVLVELTSEEANYRNLMANLLNLADVKMNIKNELKEWEKEFEHRTGRQPNMEDKAVMNERYIAYKMICNQVQDAKDLVKASEDKIKELKERVKTST